MSKIIKLEFHKLDNILNTVLLDETFEMGVNVNYIKKVYNVENDYIDSNRNKSERLFTVLKMDDGEELFVKGKLLNETIFNLNEVKK